LPYGGKKWLALKPWTPFFWENQLPTGVYLRSEQRPALLPSGYKVDEEIYFAIRLRADVEGTVLLLHRYAFLTDPGKHTERSVRKEGYWHFDVRGASSPLEAVTFLKDLMCSLETLAFGRDISHSFPEAILIRVVAWEERMALAIRKSWPESAIEKPCEQGAFPDSIEYQTSLFQLSSARRL
jgi:hypothetical protein